MYTMSSQKSDDYRSLKQSVSWLTFKTGLALITLLMTLSCSNTSDINASTSDKTFYGSSSDPYLDSSNAFDDDSSEWAVSDSDQAVIDDFLSLYLGEPQSGDLTNGEILVAGPAANLDVVISCQEGALYVVAGGLTGALATAVAGSGLFAAGVGVAGTSTASIPLYAAAGSMIGLAASAPSWSQCFGSLAYLGFILVEQGYLSVARGFQSVLQRPARNRDTAGTSTRH